MIVEGEGGSKRFFVSGKQGIDGQVVMGYEFFYNISKYGSKAGMLPDSRNAVPWRWF
ncbi:MAG: hypothetical protein PUB21_04855 [Bacteroidales bacterium]|nr:hypothetical protein [Bacteroidales bacterium]